MQVDVCEKQATANRPWVQVSTELPTFCQQIQSTNLASTATYNPPKRQAYQVCEKWAKATAYIYMCNGCKLSD